MVFKSLAMTCSYTGFYDRIRPLRRKRVSTERMTTVNAKSM